MSKSTTSQAITAANYLPNPLENVLSRLPSAKKSGKGWQAKCPAHKDKTPSLSVNQSSDGKVLLTCHTGCTVQAIVSALGLQLSDLFPPKQAKPRYIFDAAYDYRDESGNLIFQVVRMRLDNPSECPDAKSKTFYQRRPDGKGGWIKNTQGVRRVLYRLPEIIAANPGATVFIVEGEKDVDRLRGLGLEATTNPRGAGKWRDEYSDFLVKREVVILPDNDDTGRSHALDIAKSLHGKASSIRILELPNLPKGGDVSDWLDAGGDESSLCQMADATPEWRPADSSGQTNQASDAQTAKGKKFDVIELALNQATFFHDEDNKHFASVKVGSRVETYPVESKPFKTWLAGKYFEATGAPLYGDAFKEAIATLQAIAQYQGKEQSVFLRLAEHKGNIYLDLCDSDWRIVEITPDDSRVIESTESPVLFIRRPAMMTLPQPVAGGDVAELRAFLNVEDDDTWVLIISWLIMVFHPSGPYPILSVCGEQGSAKTSACRMLRSLTDPNRADLRAAPRGCY